MNRIPQGAVRFFDKNQEEVGMIFVNDNGELAFQGKVTATAELFIEEVLRIWNSQIEWQEYEDDEQ